MATTPRSPHRQARWPARAALAAGLAIALAAAWPALGLIAPAARSAAAASRPPVLAYYYMWFTKTSWGHAKTDLPALGPYVSTDATVIAQQVAWAKASGVDAFIASWKHTPSLDEALAELVAECHRQGLKLVLIYEGLDVSRNPLPVTTVGADLAWFESHYGSDPAFDVFGKPAVVWSGTWKFNPAQIAAVRSQVGAPDRLLLLGSEKDAASYTARAGLFDGDAYYWSSADPATTPGYEKRLAALGRAVHADHGLWLAPAAAGFDARLNGGTTVVDRRGGDTLRQAWSAALGTSPDGIAVISWNEYTENSYIEPSRNYGTTYLQVLASLTGAPGPGALLPGAGAPASAPPQAPSASPAAPTDTPISGAAATTGGSGPGQDLVGRFGSLIVAGLVLTALLAFGLTARRRTAADRGLETPEDGLDD